jgi:hypothetical protein
MRSKPQRARGSALVLAIILSLVISGMVAAMAWVAGTQSQVTGSMSKADQAFYAAESGASRVAWYCKQSKMSSITSPISGTLNGNTYTTSWTSGSGSSINVSSNANNGTMTYSLSVAMTPPSSGVPMFASGSNFDNKNISITGNVAVGGDYSNGGSGSLNGNLIYAGNANNTGSVTGTISKGTFTAINFSTLDTTLRASATTKSPGQTYDFTAISGTNKVIYVNGDVTDPTIIGSGTLYVNGNIIFSSQVTVGATGAPVYLVSQHDVTFNKKSSIVGGIYAAGNLNRAQLDLTGIIYVAGVANSNNGQCTWTFTSPAWFDPRNSGGGSGSSQLTEASFMGPAP